MQAPANTVVILGGVPYQLRWDKGAMFRADSLGLFDANKPGIGFAAAIKYVWCMAPAALRDKYATPEALADVFPDAPEIGEIWQAINNAVEAGKGGSEKNGAGSTSGPLPASS